MWESIKKNREIAVFIAFLIIGLAVYANSFGNQFFWDDNDEIVNNIYVQHFDVSKMFSQSMISGAGQTDNYYRPILLLSYAVDYQLWGMNPFGFNLIDVLLHIFNAWLIFILLYFLLSLRQTASTEPPSNSSFERKGVWLAFLPALIFLVHPLNTEAVDYVSGRADVLYAFWALLSLLFYYYFFQAKNVKGKIINYSVAVVFFIFSLLTKETAVVLPFLAVLMELVFLAKGDWRTKTKTAAKNSWPFFLVLAVYLLLHLTVFNFSHLAGVPIGCQGEYCSFGIVKRFLVFGSVTLNYFQILFVPLGLHMERAVTEFGSVYSWKTLAAWFAVLVWAAVAVIFWKKSRSIAFGLFWFFILLLPTSGILVRMNYPTYEHFLYLPMIGFWLALGGLICLAADNLKNDRVLLLAKILFYVMLSACVVFWGILTIRRNLIWHDPITFYENNLKYSPQSFIEHTNLGIAYDNAGRPTEAIAQYRQAIGIDDVYPQVHYDLANALVGAQQYDQAEKEYLLAIAMDPEFILPYRSLYDLYSYLGEKDEAGEILKKMPGNN